MIIGGRVVGRAFAEAYRQANASSQYARAQGGAGGAGTRGAANVSAGMTLDEACKILNVKSPGGPSSSPPAAELEEVLGRYKRLFDANDPQKGGSFYLQSKVVRARERLEAEIKPRVDREAEKAEQTEWKPKIYKR
jgi:mitochondrial import inner membrane translocase subunit TIM16